MPSRKKPTKAAKDAAAAKAADVRASSPEAIPGVPGSEPPAGKEPTSPREPLPPKHNQGSPS